MSAEVHSVAYDPVVKRLLERMLELERTKMPDDPAEAQYGEHSHQADFRGAHGVAVQIDNGKAIWAVALCATFSALGVGLSAFACYTATQAAMEARILQQHVYILEAQKDK